MKIKVIIVDDELNARENLQLLLNEYCKEEVEVIGLADSIAEAQKLIDQNYPDVVFLDINMPGDDGFKLIELYPDAEFSIIFTTAYNEFALKALKMGAVDYLEKPLNIEEIKTAIKKVIKNKENGKNKINIKLIKQLLEEYQSGSQMVTISIPTLTGYDILKVSDIVCLKADESYTKIELADKSKCVSSLPLARYDDILDENIFFRVHKSYIINYKHHLKSFNRHEGNVAILTNNVVVPVARRKVAEFINRIKTF